MSWWKRFVFSAVSLIFGFCSLDYLFYAFRLLVNEKNITGNYNLLDDGVMQLIGIILFVIWFVILACYIYCIRKSSNQIDMIESDKKTGKNRVKQKWFDLSLQGGLLITGMLLRWCYLIFIYFPQQ